MPLRARSGELVGLTHSGNATETTNSAFFDTTYGIRAAASAGSADSTQWFGHDLDEGPYSGDFYYRFTLGIFNGMNSGRTLLEFLDNAEIPVFRLQITGSNIIQGQYWNGTAWTNVGGTYTFDGHNQFRCDLRISDSSFSFATTSNMALEPSEVLSGSAVMTNVTNLASVKSYSTNGSSGGFGSFLSEIIFGDEPTIGHRYSWKPPTADGTDTAGSGTFADVDETTTSDVDFTTLAANGDAETYVHGTMTLPAGTVKAVQIESRVRKVAGGAQNVKARLRVGGVTYDQATNFPNIDSNFKPYIAAWPTNPAGGSWTPTTAGQVSNEFGLLAQT